MVATPLAIYSRHEGIPEEWRHRARELVRPAAIRAGAPRKPGDLVRLLWRGVQDQPHLRDAAAELLEWVSRIWVIESSLEVRVFRRNGLIEEYGITSRKLITDTGVAFLVDAWQNTVELEIMKFHALGTGSTAESAAQTALTTELTTQYTGNVRATGSLTEGATANIFRSVGTNTLDETPGSAIQEHGLMSQAATGGGTMWDRSLTGGQSLSSGDALQSTYDMTASSGG